MYNISTLINDLFIEMSLVSTGISYSVIENLLGNYVIPSFNRDYPQIMTMVIRDQTRFYPYIDLTDSLASRYLNHVYLIKQEKTMYMQLETQMGYGSADNFVTITATDVVQKIIRFSYKNNCFVTAPTILYDDISNDYYYALERYNRYILIFSILNTIDSTGMINPNDYEALKWYSAAKIGEFVITGIDMSSIGVVNEYLNKIMEGISTSDTTNLFNPAVSSLSFGGEISIGFTPTGTVTSAVQAAIPIIRNAYRDIQDSLRKYIYTSYRKFRNIQQRKYM